jgi:hypothetical protein
MRMALKVRQVSLDRTAGFTEKVKTVLEDIKKPGIQEETT